MKQFIAIMCFIILLASTAFTPMVTHGAETKQLKKSPYTHTSFSRASSEIKLAMEHEVYSPDIASANFTITNNSDKVISFGLKYELEVSINEEWYSMPSTGWDAVGISMMSGDTYTNEILIAYFKPNLGNYRLVKEINDQYYAAYFTLGSSPYTNETPFGYQSLEKLSAEYGFEQSQKNSDVIFMDTSYYNVEKINEFLEKVMIGMPAMLRTVTIKEKSGIYIEDIIYNGEYFLLRKDASRLESSQQKIITDKIYSFMVSDRKQIFLSDFCSVYIAEKFGRPNDKVLILSEMRQSTLQESAKKINAWSERNPFKYKSYSEKGDRNVSLYYNEPLQYGKTVWYDLGSGMGGSTENINDSKSIAVRAVNITWLDNDRFYITCETSTEEKYYVVLDALQDKELWSGYGKEFPDSTVLPLLL